MICELCGKDRKLKEAGFILHKSDGSIFTKFDALVCRPCRPKVAAKYKQAVADLMKFDTTLPK